MTLEELGAVLKEKRESRGLSTAQVADSLKIAERHVLGLEAGDLSSMPHKAYARGFLRSYAKFIGVSEEDYEPVLHSLAPEQNLSKAVYEPDITARPHRDTRWMGILLSLLVACLIGWAVWHFGLINLLIHDGGKETSALAPMQSKDPTDVVAQISSRRDNATVSRSGGPAASGSVSQNTLPGLQSPAQKTPGMPAGAGSASSAGSPTQGDAARQPLAGVVPAGSPWGTLQGNATLAGKAGLAASPSQPQATPASTNPNLPPALLNAAPADGQHKLVLVADETCWMQVTSDSGKPQQHTLHKGDSLPLSFSNRLVLRLGNAGGVRIVYDGQEFADRGRVGQVRTLTFPPTTTHQ